MKSKVAQILIGGIDRANKELRDMQDTQNAHAEEVQQLRALVLKAEREAAQAEHYLSECGRLDRENHALVAILCKQGWPAERIADEVKRKLQPTAELACVTDWYYII